jgi:TldD protein
MGVLVSIEPEFISKLSYELRVEFIDVRFQRRYYELIVLDNGVVRDFIINTSLGAGVRVIVDGSTGYSSTSTVTRESIREAVIRAYKVAKASKPLSLRIDLYKRPIVKAKISSHYSIEPESIDYAEKIQLLRDMYNVAKSVRGVSSATLRFGYEHDYRVYISSLGDHVEVGNKMIGVSLILTAHVEGVYETLYDQESIVGGWEFIKSINWDEWALERSKLVVETARSQYVKPGKYDIILDNDMVGLLLHEAFGHATEGDLVMSGSSVLRGRIGEKIASDLVTVVDNGVIEGGAFIPYDDEGTPKRKIYTVKNGVLTNYLHSLSTALMLNSEPTGNARVMGFEHPLLVRQTNTYMEPGDWSVEELFRDTKRGLYIKGRGARGGEVNTLTGAFTFTSGPSYIIENGESTKLVKGVMLSGLILETLRNVDAVARDLVVRTSVFGGCGKSGQTVRVGDGGPHVRVRGFTIGGG